MEVKEYQDKALSSAIYKKEHSIIYPTLGISGEAGEIVEHVKKAKNHKHPWDHQALAYELGDSKFYISRLSNGCESRIIE